MMKDGDKNKMKIVWEQMQGGDEHALAETFTYYYSGLYRYGIKIFNLPDLVKDSIQDLFLKVWEKRGTLGEVQNPEAYLVASFRRKLFENKEKYFKKTDREKSQDDGETFSFSAVEFLETQEVSDQLRHLLAAAVNSLPERQRELVFLRFYYGLRYAEIARIMEVKEQTIKNMMQRAIASLRGKLDPKLWEAIDFTDDLMMTLFLLFGKV